MTYNEKLIEGKLTALHTAFAGKVLSVSGKYAAVQPLTYSKSASGALTEQAQVAAYIPDNVKLAAKTITYVTDVTVSDDTAVCTTESAEVLAGADIEAGDIVFCGVLERDFSAEQLDGDITEPTRRHDMNDAVVLTVL